MAKKMEYYAPDYSGMLKDADFCNRYKGVTALASNGTVTSALTKSSYIYYDYKQGKYIKESRYGR